MTSRNTGPTNLQPNSIDSLAQFFKAPVLFSDRAGATERIESICRAGLTSELIDFLLARLAEHLVPPLDADLVFARFTRFLLAARSPQALVMLLQRDPDSLHSLIRLFSASGWLADCLIDDPEAFDLLRMTGGQPIERAVLVDEINAEVASAETQGAAEGILRRHRRRETLRIAFGDLVQGHTLDRTCEQLTFLADAIVGAAIQSAFHLLSQKKSDFDSSFVVSTSMSHSIALTCIATGGYGGKELDYGSQLDVLFVAQVRATQIPYATSGASADLQLETIANGQAAIPWTDSKLEFVRKWAELVVSILSANDPLGPTYELNFRLRPRSEAGIVADVDKLLGYFELSGRTWHRQEFIKARLAAGDVPLGQQFLASLQPWVYRRYLGTADQEGIRSLKRKMTRWTEQAVGDIDVGPQSTTQADHGAEPIPESGFAFELAKLVRSTSAEIEYVIRFLQLLNGSDLPSLRIGNTLRAIEALEQAGCLTMQERTLLTDHYLVFRKLGHRLQLASPTDNFDDGVLGKTDPQSLRSELMRRRGVCRRIVDHLIHDVFTDAEEIPPETEMVLDPDFDQASAHHVLSSYGFSSPEGAYGRLLSSATESIRFLSERRSRHFLAGIAPRLLEEISGTPSPDMTLERFALVSDSLGGKAALFELFQTNPSTLRLCIRLCAISPYLTGILTSNPGMLDELIDSLLLDRLPQFEELEAGSKELCRFAEDIEPILHSLKNSAHLRIGVRDVLGRDCIRETHRAIADTAEVCLRRIAEDAWQDMVDRFGRPLTDAGEPVGLTMVALGKLGGREPNYHSDLDVVFIYDADGQTKPLAGGRRDSTSNSHFFHELTQRISKRANHYGPWGRMFELDARIRFSHDRGAMAVTIEQFRQHFGASQCRLWQRLALVNARIIYRTDSLLDDNIAGVMRDAEAEISDVIRRTLTHPTWTREMAVEAAGLRTVLERGASPENIKRGAGGTMDVEAIIQMLLLRRAAELEGKLGVGTLEGLDLLRTGGWITIDRSQQLATGYRYLRSVESNLRLMNLPARHDLPHSADDLRALAFAMRETHLSIVAQKCDAYREINRQLFETIFTEEAGQTVEVPR